MITKVRNRVQTCGQICFLIYFPSEGTWSPSPFFPPVPGIFLKEVSLCFSFPYILTWAICPTVAVAGLPVSKARGSLIDSPAISKQARQGGALLHLLLWCEQIQQKAEKTPDFNTVIANISK